MVGETLNDNVKKCKNAGKKLEWKIFLENMNELKKDYKQNISILIPTVIYFYIWVSFLIYLVLPFSIHTSDFWHGSAIWLLLSESKLFLKLITIPFRWFFKYIKWI
jgi:hypothetical protein